MRAQTPAHTSGEYRLKGKKNQLSHLYQSLSATHSASEHRQPQSWEAVCCSGFHSCLTFPVSILTYSRSSLSSPFGAMDFVEFYTIISVLSLRQILQCCSSYHKVITWPFFRPVWIRGWNSPKRLRSQKIKLGFIFSQFSWLHTKRSQQLENSDRQLDWVYQMVNWSLSHLPKSLGIKNRSIFYWH